MPEEETLQERTEEPTPRRREEARKRGQVVKSRELSSVAILGSGFLMLFILSYIFFQQFYLIFTRSFDYFSVELNFDNIFYIAKTFLFFTLKIILPLFLIMSLAGILVYLLQTGGGVWASEVITPKIERINPVEGFKRIFSLVSLFELIKALIKLAIIIGVTYWIIQKNFYNILKLLGVNVNYIAFCFKVILKEFVNKLIIVLIFLAILDWLYNRWDVERKLKMTRQELKEELKHTEGDPWVKARIRQRQREIARARMLAEVPKADVVITNPEHYAVALKYEFKKMPAPQVIAKGKRFLAQKIKEIARKYNVPIYEDPILAQILYAKVKIGEYIPEDLYKAIAKILAYVYKIKNKKII